jgi:hypothetical protein
MEEMKWNYGMLRVGPILSMFQHFNVPNRVMTQSSLVRTQS